MVELHANIGSGLLTIRGGLRLDLRPNCEIQNPKMAALRYLSGGSLNLEVNTLFFNHNWSLAYMGLNHTDVLSE